MAKGTITEVADRIIKRSERPRAWYLHQIKEQKAQFASNELGPRGRADGCSNCAHAFAGATEEQKEIMSGPSGATLAIIDSGNDVISSGQPYEGYRQIIRDAAEELNGVAQVAGGVPAMCDGVTQGFSGMELSLFSRNNIAQGSAIALAPNTHDGAILLGECDKIFPGLVMGAASFGHLPVISIPSGPMPTGISNQQKKDARDSFKKGEIGLPQLQKTENESYHAAGVCTFFGTANTNKAIAEAMGLVLPGSSFINPGTELRDALTKDAVKRMVQGEISPLADIIDERSFVNAIVVLMAMGGSTNHTMHIPAMAKHFGIEINWDDMSDVSDAVPLIANIYPNGKADINDFQKAGGMAVVIKNLIDAGCLHEDVNTIAGQGLNRYTETPKLDGNDVIWVEGPAESLDTDTIRTSDDPFAPNGGIILVKGNLLGRAITKTSAISNDNRKISGLASVFNNEAELHRAFAAWQKKFKGQDPLTTEEMQQAEMLDGDELVIVVRGQSPKDNGMPELHKAISPLRILQSTGKKVALVTDGRLSGASGTIPAGIHLSGGELFKVRDGDKIILDSIRGTLNIDVDEAEWAQRPVAEQDNSPYQWGIGRQLFRLERLNITSPEEGAIMPLPPIPEDFEYPAS